VEGAVLGVAGFVAALGVAQLLLDVLARVVPAGLAPPGGLALDARAFGFGAAAAGLAVLVFAVVPGLRGTAAETRSTVGARLVRSGPQRTGARRALVAAQVALSLVLALGAGLLVRTVSALDALRPGFDSGGALTFSVSLRVPDTYRGPAERAAYMDEVTRRVAALPGARAVGLVGGLPLSGERWTQPYGLPGQPEGEWQENRADFRVVSSGYFDAIGTRLLEGRTFIPQEDLQETERVVVVDQRLAARLAPGGSALDRVIGIPLDGRPVEARVVGVVENVRHERLDTDGREAIYVPYRQEASRDVSFVVRTSGEPSTLAPSVREAVLGIDPRIPVHDLGSLQAYVDEAVAPRRFALALLVGFAVLALICTAVGLYGVVAHEVGRRTRDIGVHLAVGADRGTVLRSVLLSGARLGLVGIGVGLVLAAVASYALRGLVFGVGAADPVTWTAVIGLVAAVTLLATWVPARRAARLSPTEALRGE
jgi:predicted permease